jgi:CheY-like chemotaxis protein
MPEPRPLNILIVDDNPPDVYLIREAIQSADIRAEIHVVHDGEAAIRFFETADADAKTDGRRGSSGYAKPGAVQGCSRCGANEYAKSRRETGAGTARCSRIFHEAIGL